MKLFKRERTPVPALSRTEALACIPVVLPAVNWQHQQTGDILIEYPLQLKPLLSAIFARFNPKGSTNLTRKMQLDGLGSQVWLMIDGKATVGEIIRRFASASSLTSQEAEQGVTAFLRELGKRGVIGIREPKP